MARHVHAHLYPQVHAYFGTRVHAQDPRLHACINSASISSPDMRTEAYDPTQIDAQMDAQVRACVRECVRECGPTNWCISSNQV